MSTITTGKVVIYKPNFNVNPVDTLLDLPVLGAENTLYVIKDTGAIYLWNGSEFITYDSRPYKVYTALLTQSGTDAPVAIVLENTLGGEVVWSYDSVGVYVGTLSGAFDVNKTALYTSQSSDSNNDVGSVPYIFMEVDTIDDILVHSIVKSTNAYSDGLLYRTTIEIRVYP